MRVDVCASQVIVYQSLLHVGSRKSNGENAKLSFVVVDEVRYIMAGRCPSITAPYPRLSSVCYSCAARTPVTSSQLKNHQKITIRECYTLCQQVYHPADIECDGVVAAHIDFEGVDIEWVVAATKKTTMWRPPLHL